ncbi:IPT/TIG domain-containing protein [Limnoglobus roseus]|uniref:IPT/TIG domain-containing protein n=1 Tax=Limnoglobus roseus TaxID=2598579 RepID=UPI00143D9C63|nr:IPT/TIG domain-containing protein [Limnoglobus roseus]
MRHAYGADQVSFPGGIVGDGAGQVIAVVDAYVDPNIASDLHAFDQQFGLSDPYLYTVNVDGTPVAPRGDWGIETSLDVEWVHVMAPKATILLVEADPDDLYTAVEYARQQDYVTAVSMSWGLSEFNGEANYDGTFTTPAGHTGITFVASTGDNGAPGGYPAYSPNVLAVGGTNLSVDASGNYVGETGWSNPPGGPTGLNHGGSGGGISQYEGQPSYQRGTVTQSTTRRTIPDVALDASTDVAVYDSFDFGSAAPWISLGGTSLSAPLMAGLIADANNGRLAQSRDTLRDREAMTDLYALDGLSRVGQLGAVGFNDVTQGNNGFPAGPGYDLVTGLGTPKASAVAANLAQACLPPALIAPNGLTTQTSTTPTFQWAASAGAGFYRITVRGPDGATVINTTASGTSYTPAAGVLTSGASYTWQVQAYPVIGAVGTPATGTIGIFSVTSATPYPEDPSVNDAVATLTPTFRWSAVAGATGYNITVTDAVSHQTAASATGLTTTTWTSTTPLVNGRGYTWQVQAITSSGGQPVANPPSAPLGFYVNVTSTLALTAPSANATVTTPTPHLEWTPMPLNYQNYSLSVYDVTAGRAVISELGIDGSSGRHAYDLPVPLPSGHTYQWTVNCGPYYSILQNGVPTTVDQRVFASAKFTVAVAGATGALIAPTVTGPTGLIATTTPTFGWSAVPGATGYGLYINSSAIAPIPVSGTSFTYTGQGAAYGLQQGQAYVWWVVAYDAAGNVSPASAPTDFGVASPAASYLPIVTPTGPIGTIATLTPTLSWTCSLPANNIQGYYLYLFDETAGGFVLGKFDRSSSYDLGAAGVKLINNHAYRWYVSGVSIDVGAASEADFTVQLIAPPHPLPVSVQPTTPVLSWAAVPGASGYALTVTDETHKQTLTANLPVTGTNYQFGLPLQAGDLYRWTVTAADAAGNVSDPSQFEVFTVEANIPAPTLTPVGNIVATDTPTLAWNAVTGVAGLAGYALTLIDTTTGMTVVAGQLVTATSYLPLALTDGHHYQWTVTAVDSAGNASLAVAADVFRVALPVSAAAVPVPDATPAVVGDTPTLTWAPANGAAGYVVVVFDASGGTLNYVVPPTPVADTAFTVPAPLMPGRAYTWQVRATDAAGNLTAWSARQKFTSLADLKASTMSAAAAALIVGGTTTLTLTARDANGNQETAGGLPVAFIITVGEGNIGAVTDNNNGTYTATYTATAAGPVSLTATVGNQMVTSAAVEISVSDRSSPPIIIPPTGAIPPAVAGVSPGAGPAAGGSAVTVTGSGFTGATAVLFGSTIAAFTVVSDTQLTATAPAGAGAVDVVVVGPGGASAASPADRFTYTTAPLGAIPPAVAGVSPGAGPAAGGSAVTVTGSGFTGATAVLFGSTIAAFTVVSDTQLTATAPAGAGAVDVVVVGPGGASAASPADRFTYTTAPLGAIPPAVAGVSPGAGPAAGGSAVTVTGSGFTGATAVLFGSTIAAFTVVSDTQLTATAPAGAGAVDVVVVGPGGASAASPADRFTYTTAPLGAIPPAVAGVSPGAGPAAGGSAVTVTGSGFTGATAVLFGSTIAAFTVVSDTQLTATAPAGAGAVDVVVVGPGGASAASPADQFTYTTAPLGAQKTQLVGYSEYSAGADEGAGQVTLYNRDGSVRYTVSPFGQSFAGGVRTAAADFNGDGVADVVAGTGPGGSSHVVVLDGVTGTVLFAVDPFEASFTGGVYVAAGDLDGDGVPDLVVTPDEGGGPRVDVYSGNGYVKRVSFFGIDDPNFRGGARATVADLNGDGVGDLVVVAGFGGGPRVAAFDGKSLAGPLVKLFNDFFAFEQTLRNGVFVTAGDVNGDGVADLVVGGGPGGGPRVLAFDGKSLLVNQYVPLVNFFGGDASSRGGIRVVVKNLDGDTKADLVVGSGSGSGSRVTAYFGRTLTAGSTATALDFDAFPAFTGGVFVG